MGHIVLLDLHVPCFYLDHFAKKHLWHLVSERQDHEKSRTLRQDISCCQWCFPYTKTILQRTHVELSTLCRWDVERNGCSESSLCSRKVKSLYKQRSLFLLVTSVLRPCFLCVILLFLLLPIRHQSAKLNEALFHHMQSNIPVCISLFLFSPFFTSTLCITSFDQLLSSFTSVFSSLDSELNWKTLTFRIWKHLTLKFMQIFTEVLSSTCWPICSKYGNVHSFCTIQKVTVIQCDSNQQQKETWLRTNEHLQVVGFLNWEQSN